MSASFGGPGLNGRPFGKNQAPEASASARRSVGLGSTIKLDGSDSGDPDGDSLRYRWTFTARPAGSTLTDADVKNRGAAPLPVGREALQGRARDEPPSACRV